MADPAGPATLTQLWRYPVKSMAGEPIESGSLSWYGLAGDRRWGFVRPEQEVNGFPWHTIREDNRLCLYSARLRDPDRPNASTADVRTPAGQLVEVTDPTLPERLGPGLRLMRLHRGVFDSSPVSLIGTATVEHLCAAVGVTTDVRRFRPNLLVETTAPFEEDGWVGRTVRIGAATLRVDRRNKRCVIIGVDPDSGREEPGLLRLVARSHDSCAGVYATVATPGALRVGDGLQAIAEP